MSEKINKNTANKTQSEEFLRKASEIASFYGFEHILNKLEESKLIEEPEEESFSIKKNDKAKKGMGYSEFEEACIDLAEIYYKNKLHKLSHPFLTYYSNGDSKKNSPTKRSLRKKEIPCFTMQVVGINKHIGEAVLLKTALIILKEAGYQNFSIALNSVGNENTANNFEEFLSEYIKNNFHTFPTKCRLDFKKDTIKTFECIKKHSPVLLPSIPKPIQFISESSRNHLRQIIEHLDVEDAIYELDDSMIGPREFYSETVFEIRNTEEENEENKIIATGGRYNSFLKNFLGAEIPAIGITIKARPSKETLKNAPAIPNGKDNAKIYLIQIGFEARIKSFELLENLRKEGIKIAQSVINEKMDPQVKEIEEFGFEYIVIIGQKEALENMAIVRKIETQTQVIIPLKNVVKYIKSKKLYC